MSQEGVCRGKINQSFSSNIREVRGCEKTLLTDGFIMGIAASWKVTSKLTPASQDELQFAGVRCGVWNDSQNPWRLNIYEVDFKLALSQTDNTWLYVKKKKWCFSAAWLPHIITILWQLTLRRSLRDTHDNNDNIQRIKNTIFRTTHHILFSCCCLHQYASTHYLRDY